MKDSIQIIRTKKRYSYMPSVRMDKEEIDAIKERAKQMGMSYSQFVRYCIAKELESK